MFRLSVLAVALAVGGKVHTHGLHSIGVPLYVADGDGVFLWVNASARALFGDVVGRQISSVVAPEQIGRARREFARKVTGQVTETDFDLILLDATGERVRARIHSVRLASDGSGPAVFGVALPARGEIAETDPSNPHDRPPVRLTPRQQETLLLLGDGLETPMIAARLGISPETARNHIRAVMHALGAHSRLEAVAVAHRIGLLPPPPNT